jgi:hypothetical protein
MAKQLDRTKIAAMTAEIVAEYARYHRLQVLDVPNVSRRSGLDRCRSEENLSQLCRRSRSAW